VDRRRGVRARAPDQPVARLLEHRCRQHDRHHHLQQLLANIGAFPDRIARTNGIITGVDLRTGNFGSRRTEGLEVVARAGTDLFGGVLTAGLDGTRLFEKKEKLLPNLPTPT
jgi:hypothetical protein